MDFQRFLIIGVIAVLSFMLLTEWREFSLERAQQPVARVQPQTGPAPVDLPDTPAPVAETAQAAE